MKKLAVSTMLSISLVLFPQVAVADDAGVTAGNTTVAANDATAEETTDTSSLSSGTRTAEDYKQAFGGVKEVWTTILAMAAVAGALAVIGKIGADLVQQQAA